MTTFVYCERDGGLNQRCKWREKERSKKTHPLPVVAVLLGAFVKVASAAVDEDSEKPDRVEVGNRGGESSAETPGET